jgi:hypothetical protein
VRSLAVLNMRQIPVKARPHFRGMILRTSDREAQFDGARSRPISVDPLRTAT